MRCKLRIALVEDFKGKPSIVVFKAKHTQQKNWKLIRIGETGRQCVRSAMYKDVDWDPLPRCLPFFCAGEVKLTGIKVTQVCMLKLRTSHLIQQSVGLSCLFQTSRVSHWEFEP